MYYVSTRDKNARHTAAEAIEAAAAEALAGYEPLAVAAVATIDLKQDEPGLRAFCAARDLPLLALPD